jgi:hypothetical protein
VTWHSALLADEDERHRGDVEDEVPKLVGAGSVPDRRWNRPEHQSGEDDEGSRHESAEHDAGERDERQRATGFVGSPEKSETCETFGAAASIRSSRHSLRLA